MHPLVFQEFQRNCARRGVAGRILRHRDFPIIQGDTNRLPFPDDNFDAVVCNSVLEHDRFFWRSLAEMKRVTRAGGVVMIGTPGYTELSPVVVQPWLRVLRLLGRRAWNWLDAALTLPIHNYPADYYRFSPQAFHDVFLAGLLQVEVRCLLVPPRIIGVGVVPDHP
jgi:SAM-dependent methyltransferase